ncbi:hypothetical protein KM043_015705 [Ampulex compressa]|nr:hypothetical protein KM043_015705 [Ampulex compressa]
MLRMLETMNWLVEHWDNLPVIIVVPKLDVQNCSEWEAHLGASRELPLFKRLKKLLSILLLSANAQSLGEMRPTPKHRVTKTTVHHVQEEV